jgi:large subunit ribosomal protein L3
VIARKVGMMRVFGEDNSHIPVTVLDLAGCQVVGRRTVNAEEFKNSAGEAVALKPKKSRKNEKNAKLRLVKPRAMATTPFNSLRAPTKAKNKTAS